MLAQSNHHHKIEEYLMSLSNEVRSVQYICKHVILNTVETGQHVNTLFVEPYYVIVIHSTPRLFGVY